MRWGHTCVTALEQARAEIDGLNVFPVPDSDTGKNLLATMRAATAEADAAARVPAGVDGEAAVTAEPEDDIAVAPVDRTAHETAGGVSGELMGVDAEECRGGAGREQAGRRSGTGTGGAADRHPGAATGEHAGWPLRAEENEARGDAAGDVHRYATAMAYGATVGARGNSGIILAQVLRGVAEATRDGGLTGATYRTALARAAQLVRGSLSEPVEGTILTVLDRASAAARECAGPGLAEVARAAAEGAARALDETRDQLAVLRAAGVVDAGARGLLVLLDTMVEAVTGETPVRRAYPAAAGNSLAQHRHAVPEAAHYEVMFRIDEGEEDRAAWLRSRLTVLGDSVVVAADGAGGWAVHVHCADAGAAVEAGMTVGRVRDIRIEYLAGNHRDTATAAGGAGRDGIRFGEWGAVAGLGPGTVTPDGVAPGARPSAAGVAPGAPAAGDAAPAGDMPAAELGGRRSPVVGRRPEGGDSPGGIGVRRAAGDHPDGCSASSNAHGGMTGDRGAPAGVDGSGVVDRAVLAVAAGVGAAELFEAAGAVVLGAEPALESAALLAAIRRMPHREVLVLPNGALPAHELVAVGAAARDAHRDVLLLPSASMVQGLAALAVHDRARIAVDDAFAMSEAAAATRWGALRRAEGRALTMVGTCAPGDGLGLVGHDVVVIDRDTRAAGYTLLDRMLGLGGELVTLLVGAGAPDGLAGDLAEHIGAEFPGVEVTVYSGGQRGDLIQIGVE
ncbi:DAK2 domain-containing protein [Nocardia carnea]|uniref:DAK2 domain-containing protein n=1 Tax=Nocardia carnea TaxID=37328 RepID=UPI0032B01C99